MMQYNLIHQSRLQVAMKENIQIFFSDERSPITKLIKSSYRGDKSLFLYPLRNNGKYQDISFTWGAKTCFFAPFCAISINSGCASYKLPSMVDFSSTFSEILKRYKCLNTSKLLIIKKIVRNIKKIIKKIIKKQYI